MKSRIAVLLAIILSTFTFSPAFINAQSQQTKQEKDDSLVLRANEVLLDVVVRDKKGKIIKDLKQSDFEIYEDNEKQDISSFTLVSREAAAVTDTKKDVATTAPATTSEREPFANLNLIAMVFDHLSPDARNLARRAATTFVDENIQRDDMAMVCVIDRALNVIQQYTGDTQLLKQAVDRATSTAASSVESGSAQRRPLEERQQSITDRLNSASGSVGGGSGNSGGEAGATIAANAAEQAVVNMQIRTLETFEMLERNQHGLSQIHSLLAIINSLRNVPGRKAIILFSEGVALPPDVRVHFPSVINAATRAGVSIYSVESGGLRTESGNAEAAREINAMGNRRSQQNATGREERSARPMTMQLERSEDVLRLNPKSGLSELSASTGGFLISDTNDFSIGLRRIDEDLRTHYVLAYTPKNSNLDGKFRQINVKLSRGGLDVQTRKGYYALPSTGSSPVLDYEAAALAAMSSSSTTNPFTLRSLSFNFPVSDDAALTPVLAEVPAKEFTYTPNSATKTYSTDFTIIALIKNESGQTVSKLSRHYTLSGPIEKMEEAKKGEVLFYREERLPVGKYTVETAAYDKPSGKVSVSRHSLEVAESDAKKLRMSSVMILKRGERLNAEEQKQGNPFQYGELLVYPNLGEEIKKSGMKEMAFLFNVYVAEGMKSAPRLGMEVSQGGKFFARINGKLTAPDGSGRIQYASTIPVESFAPGNYEMKVTVSDGATTVMRTIPFIVAQ
jgi:VWFA-related protein